MVSKSTVSHQENKAKIKSNRACLHYWNWGRREKKIILDTSITKETHEAHHDRHTKVEEPKETKNKLAREEIPRMVQQGMQEKFT